MSLQVKLAGHNVDVEALHARLAGKPEEEAGALSPETLSAAYARISRDPRDVPELRRDARNEVEQARKSNRAIIFKMGHVSVAEHAVFNLDVLDLSRLATEALEHHRLASYTEKSQRYIRLEQGFTTPPELAGSALSAELAALCRGLFETYQELAVRLTEHGRASQPQTAAEKQSQLEARANEDARYALPLCTRTQLGMTVNARTLELMIRRAASHPLQEVQALGQALFEAVRDAAPSVIRYIDPTPYFRDSEAALAVRAQALFETVRDAVPAPGPVAVRLVQHTPDPDRWVAAALLFSASAQPLEVCRQAAFAASAESLQGLFREVFCRMEPWDVLPRAFEQVELTFELTLSAAAHAQLKRHRMATLLAQPYEPSLGRTIPEAIQQAGLSDVFQRGLDRSEQLFGRIAAVRPEVAPYALTNAHHRRVLFRINARALGHFARLRCDAEAQWDIRRIAQTMVERAQEVMPQAAAFLGGKDCFERLKQDF